MQCLDGSKNAHARLHKWMQNQPAAGRSEWKERAEDFKWFKQMTTGQVVVMGRKTFEAIGRPLPNRETIILSRSNFLHPGVRTVAALGEIDPANETREVFICGGAQIYEQALPLCSDLYLTLVKRVVPGDAFFPRFEDRFQPVAEVMDGADFKIIHYRNSQLS